MLIVFVVDTSASMQRIIPNGLSLLDCAKSAVEHFIKKTSRDPFSRSDRYMLVTCAKDPVDAVKIGWRKCMEYNSFMDELKNLEANDLSDIGQAMHVAFDLMGRYRNSRNLDTYAQGHSPAVIDPSICILLTDAMEVVTANGIQDRLIIPKLTIPGSESTIEPYRWDMRVFTLVLKIFASGARNPAESDPDFPHFLKDLSERTGGQLRIVSDWRGIPQQIDRILLRSKKIGVMVSFQPAVGMDGAELAPTKCMLTYSPSASPEYFWVIPENYDVYKQMKIVPRSAHPTIHYHAGENQSAAPSLKIALEVLKFPADVYPIDGMPKPCPPRGVKWPVYVESSRSSSNNDHIGFITFGGCPELSVQSPGAVLVLLPYNFPMLFSVLQEAARDLTDAGHAPKAGNPWVFQPAGMNYALKAKFQQYFSHCPPYYYAPLKKALKRYNLHTLVKEFNEGGKNPHIVNYLRANSEASQKEGDKRTNAEAACTLSTHHKPVDSVLLPEGLIRSKSDLFTTASDGPFRTKSWTGGLARLTPTAVAEEADRKHAIPIASMGNFQEYLTQKEALRNPLGEPEPDEDTPEGLRRRQLQVHFGSPYRKQTGKQAAGVDENEAADEAAILQGGSPRRKRDNRRNRKPRSKVTRKLVQAQLRANALVTSSVVHAYKVTESHFPTLQQIERLIRSTDRLSRSDIRQILKKLPTLDREARDVLRKYIMELASEYKRLTLYKQLQKLE